MLELDRIDLGDLAMALDDHSPEHSWGLDPRTGELWMRSEYDSELLDAELRERGLDPDDLVWIEPWPSSVGYGDMEEFAHQVRDPRARELLQRAISGRGAFRRFKDTLHEFEDLREAWFARKNARDERWAIEWLLDEGLVEAQTAAAAIQARPEPASDLLGKPFDALEVARAVAADLRDLYGDRLRDVILFGSWARGDAHPESDIDLLVVLDDFDSRWEERKRMDETLYKHSLANETLVSATICSSDELASGSRPIFASIRDDGRSVS